MVKRIMIFKLKKDIDPDKFWEFWNNTHGQTFKKFPPLKKYVINRVTKVVKGEPRFWGVVEVWYENEEIYERARENSPIIKQVSSDGFDEQIEDSFTAWVEESVIV